MRFFCSPKCAIWYILLVRNQFADFQCSENLIWAHKSSLFWAVRHFSVNFDFWDFHNYEKKNSHFVLLQECDYHCVAGDMISATQPPHRMAKNAQNMRVNSSCPSLSSVLRWSAQCSNSVWKKVHLYWCLAGVLDLGSKLKANF